MSRNLNLVATALGTAAFAFWLPQMAPANATVPHRAATFLQNAVFFRADDAPTPAVNLQAGGLYNALSSGGYLSWRFKGALKVFIDGRINLYPASVIEDYVRIKYAAPGLQQRLDFYRVDVVLWYPNTPLQKALHTSEAWHQLYSDPDSVVFVRKTCLDPGWFSVAATANAAG